MSYNSTGTPRFWISTLQWLESLGMLTTYFSELGYFTGKKINYINPTNPARFHYTGNNNTWSIIWEINNNELWKNIMPHHNNFFMCLGHNFSETVGNAMHYLVSSDEITRLGREPYVNYRGNSDQNYGYRSEYNGFSIGIDNNAGDLQSDQLFFTLESFFNYHTYNIGSVLYGNYYDMPHSANLDMSMSFVMDGIKTSETLGGSTLVHRNYTQAPKWGDLGAWELGESENTQYFGRQAERDLGLQGLRRSGRRVWNLSFSYLQDKDVFPEISNLANYEHIEPSSGQDAAGLNYTGEYYYAKYNSARPFALLNEDSNKNFIGEILHKTNGGVLPFVFQPDKDDNANFAIAIIDQNSISFKQTSSNMYDVQLTIREVW